MKRLTLTTVAAAAGILALSTTAALAQRGPGGFGGGFDGPRVHNQRGPGGPAAGLIKSLAPFWENEDLVEAMGLEQSQIDLLQTSLDETLAAIEPLKGSVRDSYVNLRETLNVDSPSLEDVNAAIDTATGAQNAMMKEVLAHRVVVLNILTEEQEEILKNYRRDHLREHAGEVLALVREILADGEITPEEQAQLEALLEDLPDGVADRIRERVGNIGDGERPERPNRPDRPERPRPPRPGFGDGNGDGPGSGLRFEKPMNAPIDNGKGGLPELP